MASDNIYVNIMQNIKLPAASLEAEDLRALAVHKTLPGCPGVVPREYTDPVCQNAVPVFYYDIPCEQAMCLFPFSVYEASQRSLRTFLRTRPAPTASPAAKMAWCEGVAETLGTMNWATNVRLSSNVLAADYIRMAKHLLDPHQLEQQLMLLETRIKDSPNRSGGEMAALGRVMQQDYPAHIGKPAKMNSWGFGYRKSSTSNTQYSAHIALPTTFFGADGDQAVALAFYAKPGRQLIPIDYDFEMWKKKSCGWRCKTKRALKKISPIQEAQPGMTTARIQKRTAYVVSADETIRILATGIEDNLSRRYVSDLEAGYARWLRVYETYFLAGIVGTDPAQLRVISRELQKAKMAAGAQTAATVAGMMPGIGVIAGAAMSLQAKLLRKYGASGTAKVMCPPAPFFRSVQSELCETGTTLTTDPAAAVARAGAPVAFWAGQAQAKAQADAQAAQAAAGGGAPAPGLSPTTKILGAVALVGGALFFLRRRRGR